MQYIKKNDFEPPQWNTWFTTNQGLRSYNYGQDYQILPNLSQARAHLIAEQHNLCAYCQKGIKLENSRIEHLIPKSACVELSTNYHNLVAVCDNRNNHCDVSKSDRLIPPIIFDCRAEIILDLNNDPVTNNRYFKVCGSGEIIPKTEHPEASEFISKLNLNQETLKCQRKDLYQVFNFKLKGLEQHQKRQRIEDFIDILRPKSDHPFRQFLLIAFCKKLGIN